MGHACLHFALLNSLIHLFLCEHSKLLADSLDHHKGVVVTMNMQVWHSLEHTGIFLEHKSHNFFHGEKSITVGVVVHDVSILLKLRNGKLVLNTILVEPEVPKAKKYFFV